MARAGSPRAWVAAKTTIETSTRTRSPSRIRRTMKTAMPARRTAAGEAWGRGPATPLTEPDGAEAISECVEVQGPLARLEPLNLGAVGIYQVVEEGNDVAALLVLELLHLVDDVASFSGVHLGQRLLVEAEVVGILRWPVALVVGRGRQAAVGNLGEIVARAPEVDREGQLQVLVAVVVGIDLEVDRHAGGLGLVGE